MAKQVKCLIRNEWVAAQPEELIRQKLIGEMIGQLGYPCAQFVVEKGLKQMPHLRLSGGEKVPDRRFDLVVMAKDIHPAESLYPLLLVECKAVPLTQQVINQVTGYNHYLKAYFAAIANGEEVRTGWQDASLGRYRFVGHLPSYQSLLSSISRNKSSARIG